MKRLAPLLVMGSLLMMTAVDAQICNDRQRVRRPSDPVGQNCFNCDDYTRAQSWQSQPNIYCQGNVCPDQNNYAHNLDGTCQLCGPGQTPNPQKFNGLSMGCVSSGVVSNNPTCTCLQYLMNGQCQTCPVGQVVNSFQNGCTFRANCLAGQYYDSCNRCVSCPAGQTPNASRTGCETTAVVTTTCPCDKELNGNVCVQCMPGMTSNNLQRRCQATNNNCAALGKQTLDQASCYNCADCPAGTAWSSVSNSCQTPVVTVQNCPCYQYRVGNQCVDCQLGQLRQGYNLANGGYGNQAGQCQYQQNTCAATNQLQGTRESCYACAGCAAGYQYSTSGQCVAIVVAAPTCPCYQYRVNNQCVDCPYGQLRQGFETSNGGYGNQNGQCQYRSNNCAATQQIQGARENCYACASCQQGTVFRSDGFGGGTCTVPIVRQNCSCDSFWNGSTCQQCPAGQLRVNYNVANDQSGTSCITVNNAATCDAQNSVVGSQQLCYACQPCGAGTVYTRTNQFGQVGGTCTVPIVRRDCTCNSFWNGQDCQLCPQGQLRVGWNQVGGNQQATTCTTVSDTCHTQGLLRGSWEGCYTCQPCPFGTSYDQVTRSCRQPRPTCRCDQEYNNLSGANQCVDCPFGQLRQNHQTSQDGRCASVSQTCNQQGRVQLGREQCYGCSTCQPGQTIVNNQCTTPRPVCRCDQEYDANTNQCRNCGPNQLSNNSPNGNQDGVCQNIPLQCNLQNAIQLGRDRCYQCQPCQNGQIIQNNICVTPRPVCLCYQFVNSNNQCQDCGPGQLADASGNRCVAKRNTCNTGNQIMGNQKTDCYACIECGYGQIPNALRTACINRPQAQCNCLNKRSADGFQCIPCGANEIADYPADYFLTNQGFSRNNNAVNALNCVPIAPCDNLSIRTARDTFNCARCQRCNFPQEIPNALQTRCVIRPKPTCDCTQRLIDGGYGCADCQPGYIRDPRNAEQCIIPPACSGTNSIQLAVDRVTCGRCQQCAWPREVPDITRTSCVPRPLAVCTDCTSRQSADGYQCEQCQPGTIQMQNNAKQCYRPRCEGPRDIQYPIDNVSCGQCETCQWPQFVPNRERTSCVPRPRATCTQCNTRQSDDGYTCQQCQPGTIQDPNNPQQCIVPTCLGTYDIQLPINGSTCGRCQPCQWPRQIPNNERTACVNRPYAQCPDCLTRRSADNYSCEQCQFGQVQDPSNMSRCINRTCNARNQIQQPIDSKSCGRCETCQWPQFMPDQFKTTCIARPMAVCNCRQKQSPDGYECVECPVGQVVSLTNPKQCVQPNCGGQYEIQLSIDLNNCGRCETCQWPQFKPNFSKTQCIPRPLATCNCLSRRDAEGYSCQRCEPGTIQDPNNVSQCIQPYCMGTYQIRKPIDATSCGRCEDCQWPRYIPNNERTQCILRPFAQCDCLSRQSADGYSCEECQYGQRQDPSNKKRCIEAPRCNNGNQIVGLRDTQSCYACRSCTLPFIPRTDRSECYRPRPTCKCTEQYSPDGYSCVPCREGEISDESRNQCYPAPECYGMNEILGTRSTCYRCRPCPTGLIPDDRRRTCVRPIPVCSCTQKYSPDGYECQECPNRQIVDPNNNKRCIPQQCNQRGQIFSTRDYCYRCDLCPQGYEPNPQRTECLRIKPQCSCTEIYDSSGYVCMPCPPYQVATNGNQRCVPRQCSGLNEILGTADSCYACRECQKGSTPDNLRRRCLRYITTSCTCNQRFDATGFGCIDCPEGTRPSLDNRECVSLNCDPDQILRRDLLCPQCEWCPPGSIPDPKRENCIVKPRPAINVNGNPTCDEFSVFNMDRTECIKCPNNLKASADNLRCLNSCTDPLDIVQEDGTCFTCCNGNVPNYSRTRCVKKKTAIDTCNGDREIYNSDRSRCTTCDPYTRAQRQNSVCLSDQCSENQIITWLGTCADCLAGERKVDQYTCSGGGMGTRLNAQLVEEPTEEVSSTVAKKEKSFPTTVVAGLGILIMVLSAVTGIICMRSNEKTNNTAVQEEQAAEVENRSPEAQSVEQHLTQVMEKAPEVTDESGSGKNSSSD